MKKAVIGLVAVVAVAAVVFAFFFVNNPERKIIGKWANSSGNIVFEFSEDGKVKIPIDFFNLGLEGDISGTYVINKKADSITFNFSFLLIDYNRTCDFEFKGDTLKLTDQKSGKPMTLIKQEASTSAI